MKVITIRQPWASLIAHGIKDIENRTWRCPTKHIGTRVLIHAAVKTADFWDCPNYGIVHKHIREATKYGTDYSKYNTMAIIGSVEIVDCVINHSSIWAEKQRCTHHSPCKDLTKLPNCFDGCTYFSKPIYNWVLSNPILFDEPILEVKGKLGFWNYEFSEDDYKCKYESK